MNRSADPPYESLSFESKGRIDKICQRFEDEWRLGTSPRLESYLTEVAEDEAAALFEELLRLEVAYLGKRGIAVDPAAYQARFPQFAAIVDRVLGSDETVDMPAYEPGSRVGRYVVQKALGQGGFGTVYLAWDEELERHVALKVPKPELVKSPEEIDRIVAEARAVGQLRHPAIIAVYDVVRRGEHAPVIVMEYIGAGTLRNRMKSGQLSRLDGARLLMRIAEAVDVAHQQGFVHRDLEPGNILLDEEGNPHIADFGLAVHESVQDGRAGEAAGSPAYMSPEQVRGESNWLDGRADVWAMGVMLYEMLTGRRPFSGETGDQLSCEIEYRDPRPPRQIDRDIPVSLEQICLRCLSKKTGERYLTSGDLAEDLGRVLVELETPRKAESASIGSNSLLSRLGRRSAILPALVATLAVVVPLMCIVAGPWRNSIERTTPGPIEGMVDVRVWDAKDVRRQGVSIREPNVLPLRPGDRVRIEAALARPLFVYLLWIDINGRVSPIFPWRSGDWSRRPHDELPSNGLSLPPAADEAWTVEAGPDGTETVVLLARETPLPAGVDFRTQIRGLKAQTSVRYSCPVEMENGRILPKSHQTRSVDVGTPATLDDAVIQNQQRIAGAVQGQFSYQYSVSFPVCNAVATQ